MNSQTIKIALIITFLFSLSVPSLALSSEKKETSVVDTGSSLAEKTKAYDTALSQKTNLLDPSLFFASQPTMDKVKLYIKMTDQGKAIDLIAATSKRGNCTKVVEKKIGDLKTQNEKKIFRTCKKLTDKKTLSSLRTQFVSSSQGALKEVRTRSTTVEAGINQEASTRAALLYDAAMKDRDAALSVLKEDYEKTADKVKARYEKRVEKANSSFDKKSKKASVKKEKKLYKKMKKAKKKAKKLFEEKYALVRSDYKEGLEEAIVLYDKRIKETLSSVSAQQQAALDLLNKRTNVEVKGYTKTLNRAQASLQAMLAKSSVVSTSVPHVPSAKAAALPAPKTSTTLGASK